MIARVLRRLRRDRRGVTVVEMGLVMLPLTITLLVLFDFSYRMYAQSVLEGTLQRASRQATIGNKTSDQIDVYIKNQLAFFSKAEDPVISKKNYYQFSGVSKPGRWCDYDKDGIKDNDEPAIDPGGDGLGGSDDIVFYTVSVSFPRMFPLGKFLGWSNRETVSANMVLRNQPYGTQVIPSSC